MLRYSTGQSGEKEHISLAAKFLFLNDTGTAFPKASEADCNPSRKTFRSQRYNHTDQVNTLRYRYAYGKHYKAWRAPNCGQPTVLSIARVGFFHVTLPHINRKPCPVLCNMTEMLPGTADILFTYIPHRVGYGLPKSFDSWIGFESTWKGARDSTPSTYNGVVDFTRKKRKRLCRRMGQCNLG
jgi:hypothetical protein